MGAKRVIIIIGWTCFAFNFNTLCFFYPVLIIYIHNLMISIIVANTAIITVMPQISLIAINAEK
jgi:hypothetical protein